VGEFVSTLHIFNHYIRVPFLLLGLIEAGIFFASVYLAAHIRFSGDISIFHPGLGRLDWHAFIFASTMILSFMAMGLYQARLRDGAKGIVLRILIAYFMGLVSLAVLFYLIPKLYLGRGIVVLSMSSSFMLILLLRTLLFKIGGNRFKRRVIILGTGEKALAISELRRKTDRRGFLLLGNVHLRGTTDKVNVKNIIDLNMPLKEYCVKNEIDEIVLAIDDRRKNYPIQELLDCRMSGIDITDMASFFERETGKIKLDLLQPSWFILGSGFKKSMLDDHMKRLFDIAVSLLLLLSTWPFMLLTVLAMKLEDGKSASIIYKQIRVGEDGKPYYVLKFRSMCEGAEKTGKAKWADKYDSRITRVGSIIRKTRIDELPQIFNVLKGDMSFVGPRPERPEFVVKLSEKIPYYSERHRVKPGITGWAQICYPYGSSDKDAVEKLQYDLYYVKNYSLFMDFMIMLQTAEVIIFGKGAR
jgi:sugar transferase (PEP-CTERM system associated)